MANQIAILTTRHQHCFLRIVETLSFQSATSHPDTLPWNEEYQMISSLAIQSCSPVLV